MIRKLMLYIPVLLFLLMSFTFIEASAQRFPKPEFESGFVQEAHQQALPRSEFMEYFDIFALLAAMSLITWLILKKRSRRGVFWVSLFSIAYFGFYREGCVCSVGSLQNIALALFNPGYKMRIRFSLMPQKYADLLEPGTSKIIDRIRAIDLFARKGWDVHINFSPVIVTEGWEAEYAALFQLVDRNVIFQHSVKSEVIFLTHNKDKHEYNLKHGILGEELLWRPDIQEDKVSQYGGENIRYKSGLKEDYIRSFRSIHDLIIPWNTIRYIF